VPKCEGGEITIKLLKQHHAVQGVLQSEEYQRPCIWGWEANYLEGEMLELCKKWRAEHQHRAGKGRGAQLNKEHQSRAGLASAAKMTPEARSRGARKRAARVPANLRKEVNRQNIANHNKRRARCTVTGFVTTAGPLTRYQRARGIDPANREWVG
jgi:hypothetical protein